jgi:hypothetical protein
MRHIAAAKRTTIKKSRPRGFGMLAHGGNVRQKD